MEPLSFRCVTLPPRFAIEHTLWKFRRWTTFNKCVELAVSFENNNGLTVRGVLADKWSPFERRTFPQAQEFQRWCVSFTMTNGIPSLLSLPPFPSYFPTRS